MNNSQTKEHEHVVLVDRSSFTNGEQLSMQELNLSCILFYRQTFAKKAGSTSEDTATEKLLPAVHGASAREHALFKELIFPAFTVKKKMCSFKVCTEKKNLSWACLTSTQKERLYG